MTDTEYRALIEFHARAISNVSKEPAAGYGMMKKEAIIKYVQRLRELADNLEG